MGNVLETIDRNAPKNRHSEVPSRRNLGTHRSPKLVKMCSIGDDPPPTPPPHEELHDPGSNQTCQDPTIPEYGPTSPKLLEMIRGNPFQHLPLFPLRQERFPRDRTSILNRLTGGRWEQVEESLLHLRSLYGGDLQPQSQLAETISAYHQKLSSRKCNFGIVKDPQVSERLKELLPFIADFALKVESRLSRPITVLEQGENRTIYLNRDLACSLLANMFFCTVARHGGCDMPSSDFFGLFHDTDDAKSQVKMEKLKCILEYFSQMQSRPEAEGLRIISFERRCVRQPFPWRTSKVPLCKVSIVTRGRIEDNHGMLQVDFANKYVGGGVLGKGAVQEEIRFCISPELICSRLFTESLSHGEVLVITGSKIFSGYQGYASSFQFHPLQNSPWHQPSHGGIDDLGRDFTQVVAMDALHFKPHDKHSQYKKACIDRELHKAYAGFMQGRRRRTPVATGNWGCGAFNGDPELKFLIQWMAASVNNRPEMKYYAMEKELAGRMEAIASLIGGGRMSVGQLYKALSRLERAKVKQRLHYSVFQHVQKHYFRK